MKLLLKELNTPVLSYDSKFDPTRQTLPVNEIWQEEFTKREWTIGARAVSTTRKRLCSPETKPEPKPKKTKEGNQRKPAPSQTKSPVEADCGGEGSKQLGKVVDSVKLESTESRYNGLKDTEHNDGIIVPPITETTLKQELPLLPLGAIESMESSKS